MSVLIVLHHGLMTLLALATAAAQEGPVLRAVGPWQLQQKVGLCQASRSFSAGGATYALTLRPELTGSKYWLGYVDENGSSAFGETDVEVSASGNFRMRVKGNRSPSLDPPGGAVSAPLPSVAVNAIAYAESITLSVKGKAVIFGAPDLAPATTALQQCRAREMQSWGVDPAILADVATSPTLEKGFLQFFGYNAYPSNAVRRREQGRVVMLFTVTAAGRVSNCRLIESSGSSDLDGVSCNIALTLLRFTPAKSKAGTPVTGLYLLPVVWKLGGLPGL